MSPSQATVSPHRVQPVRMMYYTLRSEFALPSQMVSLVISTAVAACKLIPLDHGRPITNLTIGLHNPVLYDRATMSIKNGAVSLRCLGSRELVPFHDPNIASGLEGAIHFFLCFTDGSFYLLPSDVVGGTEPEYQRRPQANRSFGSTPRRHHVD